MNLLITFYVIILIALTLFGVHRYYMIFLFQRWYKRLVTKKPSGVMAELPRVTVQLPVYNEMYVVERLLKAAANLDYPKDLLEIQLIDDSSDDTSAIALRKIEELEKNGVKISYLRRESREGFKAGALAYGLQRCMGEYVLIFDADFLPPPDILKRMIPYFSDPKIGMVQARWGHINQDYSLLTRLQSLLLDGHFLVEHTARCGSGLFFNFNGTAGIWRKQAILDAGGWQADTLAEDMDLSYRAQIKGWRFLFLPEVVCPAELPVEMNAFKTQQHRWAKGGVQTARKILPDLFKRPFPFRVKLEAFVHLTGNVLYLGTIFLALFLFPSMIWRHTGGWPNSSFVEILEGGVFFSATLSAMCYYVISQSKIYQDWVAKLRFLPLLLGLGAGLSVNNGLAALEALVGHKTEFKRTPKYKIEKREDRWQSKKYRGDVKNLLWVAEVAIGIYLFLPLFYALRWKMWGTLLFVCLFSASFLYMGVLSLLHAARKSRA
ncbi:MAG: glycosyltransferase [Armatimonadetes bacterium]|nr:glycosyltransferase [Armatimonadota bacterium]